jgi:PBP1b-binding outer membrane lipoprotein LpoB
MKKIILFTAILLVGCSKDEQIHPEPNINFTDWANYGNTTFQVDTTIVYTNP